MTEPRRFRVGKEVLENVYHIHVVKCGWIAGAP